MSVVVGQIVSGVVGHTSLMQKIQVLCSFVIQLIGNRQKTLVKWFYGEWLIDFHWFSLLLITIKKFTMSKNEIQINPLLLVWKMFWRLSMRTKDWVVKELHSKKPHLLTRNSIIHLLYAASTWEITSKNGKEKLTILITITIGKRSWFLYANPRMLPPIQNSNSSIKCVECRQLVHLKCANIDFHTCLHCESE